LTARRRAQLGEYRRKRHFGVTAEPEGAVGARRRRNARLAFVVQKHRATALHES
jgi:bifunctional non-homologous end joining protein LigD